jgi:pyridoxamine 5'-phosphate oxidase
MAPRGALLPAATKSSLFGQCKEEEMDFQDCVKFATENPLCFLATAEADQPRVRALALWFADQNGFYFSTMYTKQMWKQMTVNPKVELCFYNNSADMVKGKQMRVTGKMELVDDQKLQEQAASESAFLDELTGLTLGPLWRVFRVHSGEAWFFTLADTSRETEQERIAFGGGLE